MDFVCINCGECCLRGDPPGSSYLDSDYWLNADLSDQQKQELLAARAEYPDSNQGCGMLVYEDSGLSSCLIHKLYRMEAKPVKCQKAPFGAPEIFCYHYKKYIVKSIFFDRVDGYLKAEMADGNKVIVGEHLDDYGTGQRTTMRSIESKVTALEAKVEKLESR